MQASKNVMGDNFRDCVVIYMMIVALYWKVSRYFTPVGFSLSAFAGTRKHSRAHSPPGGKVKLILHQRPVVQSTTPQEYKQ